MSKEKKKKGEILADLTDSLYLVGCVDRVFYFSAKLLVHPAPWNKTAHITQPMDNTDVI